MPIRGSLFNVDKAPSNIEQRLVSHLNHLPSKHTINMKHAECWRKLFHLVLSTCNIALTGNIFRALYFKKYLITFWSTGLFIFIIIYHIYILYLTYIISQKLGNPHFLTLILILFVWVDNKNKIPATW